MKSKILIIVAGLLIASTSAWAETITASDTYAGKTVLGDGKQIGKLSAAVRLGANYDANGYAITTSHKNGAKTFGTSHDATSIYAKDGLDTTAPSAADSGSFASGWTPM